MEPRTKSEFPGEQNGNTAAYTPENFQFHEAAGNFALYLQPYFLRFPLKLIYAVGLDTRLIRANYKFVPNSSRTNAKARLDFWQINYYSNR